MSSEIETSEAVSIPVPIAPLPAWGELYDDIHGEIEKGFPSDWRSTTGDSTAQRQAHFEKWRDDHLARVNRPFWPRSERRSDLRSKRGSRPIGGAPRAIALPNGKLILKNGGTTTWLASTDSCGRDTIGEHTLGSARAQGLWRNSRTRTSS